MIDLDIVGRKRGPIQCEHKWKDVVLYALSVGAHELEFIYENAKGGLKVLPGFVSVMSGGMLWKLVEDMEIDFSRFFHGEERIKLHRPIPPSGKFHVRGEIPNIYDKVKGALIICHMLIETEAGELLAEVEHGIYYAGAGGFGGDPGPRAEVLEPPEAVEPSFTVSCHIPENQAALYRLNGDLNPLHIDPDFARGGGFPRPILHGLCTYGYAARAALTSICDGDVPRFTEFKARFSGVVYPGDTLVTEGWKALDSGLKPAGMTNQMTLPATSDKGGRYLVRARTSRGLVLSNGYAEVKQ